MLFKSAFWLKRLQCVKIVVNNLNFTNGSKKLFHSDAWFIVKKDIKAISNRRNKASESHSIILLDIFIKFGWLVGRAKILIHVHIYDWAQLQSTYIRIYFWCQRNIITYTFYALVALFFLI